MANENNGGAESKEGAVAGNDTAAKAKAEAEAKAAKAEAEAKAEAAAKAAKEKAELEAELEAELREAKEKAEREAEQGGKKLNPNLGTDADRAKKAAAKEKAEREKEAKRLASIAQQRKERKATLRKGLVLMHSLKACNAGGIIVEAGTDFVVHESLAERLEEKGLAKLV